MPTNRERGMLAAVAAMPPHDELLVMDGRTGRAVAHRPATADEAGASVLVLGPVDAILPAGRAPAIRPNESELGWLTTARRREVRRGRNRQEHATRGTASARSAPGATSAPHGAPEAGARPNARGEAGEARTRPEVTVI